MVRKYLIMQVVVRPFVFQESQYSLGMGLKGDQKQAAHFGWIAILGKQILMILQLLSGASFFIGLGCAWGAGCPCWETAPGPRTSAGRTAGVSGRG